jgi:hypothetical protein
MKTAQRNPGMNFIEQPLVSSGSLVHWICQTLVMTFTCVSFFRHRVYFMFYIMAQSVVSVLSYHQYCVKVAFQHVRSCCTNGF